VNIVRPELMLHIAAVEEHSIRREDARSDSRLADDVRMLPTCPGAS
jgi:hypothetical protein